MQYHDSAPFCYRACWGGCLYNSHIISHRGCHLDSDRDPHPNHHADPNDHPHAGALWLPETAR